MEIAEFTDNYVEEAAQLFQKRFTQFREKFPYISEKVGQRDFLTSNLKKMIDKNPAVVALDDNQLVGYMTGYANIKNLKGSFDGVYCNEWSHSSIIENQERIYESMYRKISTIWSQEKNYTHIFTFLDKSSLLNTFHMLGFGMQVLDAARPLDKSFDIKETDYTILEADSSHMEQLKEFNLFMGEHLQSAPIFLNWHAGKNDDEQIREEFLSPDQITLLAMKGKEIISCIRGEINEGNIDFVDCPGNFGINFGYTKIPYRSTGITPILLEEILNRAKKRGCSVGSVDFETQNIEGRNFWLKYFTPLGYSVMRRIDDRVSDVSVRQED